MGPVQPAGPAPEATNRAGPAPEATNRALAGALGPLVGPYLGRQRWFAGSEEAAFEARLVDLEVLATTGSAALVWALAQVDISGDPALYQLMVGVRPATEAGLLEGQDAAILGPVRSGSAPAPVEGDALAYDALVDPELSLALLGVVTGGAESAQRARPVGAEQSNSSLVYDDRLILKVFRRIRPGPNPDVEVTLALDAIGFNHVAAPAGNWRRGDLDLAIVQEFLGGGTEGWALALTSLRDLYASGSGEGLTSEGLTREGAQREGAQREGRAGEGLSTAGLSTAGLSTAAAAGGDFGAEARRLGEMTAKLHLALARALGTEPGRPGDWADDVAAQLGRAVAAAEAAGLAGVVDREAADALVGRLRALEEEEENAGSSLRVHGDYHLGQVMRTDLGWFVLDFEGEPARALPDRRRRRSPLKDVAGMLRSFQYATAVALRERGESDGAEAAGLDQAWEQRNRQAFLQGYLSTPDLAPLLPEPGPDLDLVLTAQEVEKAAYELAYEVAYRPSWVDIPARALARLLGAGQAGPEGHQPGPIVGGHDG